MRACVYTRANTKKFYNEAIKVMPVLFSLFVGKGVNSYAFLKWLSCGTHPYRLLAPLCVKLFAFPLNTGQQLILRLVKKTLFTLTLSTMILRRSK